MSSFELCLVEWPPRGRPRVLGRLRDADLLAEARARLAKARRSEVTRLEEGLAPSQVRLVPPRDPPADPGSERNP